MSKSMFKFVNALFLAEFYFTRQQWILSKNQDRLSFDHGIHFASEVSRSKNLLDSNYLVASDWAPVIENTFFLLRFQWWACLCEL